MTYETLITIDCICGKRLTPEQSNTWSWRIHCEECGMMTGWHPKVSTAANIWSEFCNKAGKRVRMFERPLEE